VVLIGVGLALPAAVLADTGRSARTPQLRLVSLAPVTLHGTGFTVREDVRVTLRVGKRAFVRTARADRAGAFTVRFGLVALEPCRGAAVAQAVGSFGTRASQRRTCRPPDPALPT
jgi:hypothetical protein